MLDETGSWSELNNRHSEVEGAGAAGGKGKPSGGMLGFLRGKKGRDRSPKPMERGVLGKEGARMVVGGR